MFLRRFQNVHNTPCKDILKTCSRYLQDIFKIFSRSTTESKLVFSTRLQDIFKTSSICFEAPLRRVFKTYHWTNNGLLNTFSTSSQDVLRNLLRVNLIDIWKLTELFWNTLCSDCFYKLIYSCLTQVSENIMLSQ